MVLDRKGCLMDDLIEALCELREQMGEWWSTLVLFLAAWWLASLCLSKVFFDYALSIAQVGG